VGKTRLAIEGAAVAEARFSAGAWMVDLSPVSDPDLVPSVIRSQLGIQEKLGRSTLDQIADHLHSQPALLLLDNCEHVIAKSSEVIEYLTAVCPRLKVIATSREAMHIDGETVLHLRPLGPGDAFRLFEERAVAADSNFAIDVEDRRHVADICASVDGLPLAIELAAARIAAVPLEEMKHLLSNQLTLLQVPRGRPERHQSLQAAIAWSYGLLDESHQVVFSRLGVFRGFALRDAARLCAASDSDADKTPAIILDLVSKSLVQLNGERYRLLETLHNFALDRLDADRQLAPMQSRHAHYFLDVAESRQPAKLATWLDTMDAEQDNLRAAIGWALRDDIELAARLVLGLDVWWRMRARLDEARAYIDAILLKRDTQDGIQAKLLMNSGWYSSWLVSGQPELTTKPMDAALDLSRQLRSSAGLIDALLVRGRFSLDTGEASDSRVMFEEALNLSRSIGDRNRESDAVHLLAAADGAQLNFHASRQGFEQALEIKRVLNRSDEAALTLQYLAGIVGADGDLERARALIAEALQLGRKLGEQAWLHQALDITAGLAIQEGKHDVGLTLAGASDAALERIGWIPTPMWERLMEPYLENAREALGPTAADAALRAGRGMQYLEAVDFGLTWLASHR
jgi:predicted ATPase